jgi:hypothetical protein
MTGQQHRFHLIASSAVKHMSVFEGANDNLTVGNQIIAIEHRPAGFPDSSKK